MARLSSSRSVQSVASNAQAPTDVLGSNVASLSPVLLLTLVKCANLSFVKDPFNPSKKRDDDHSSR